MGTETGTCKTEFVLARADRDEPLRLLVARRSEGAVHVYREHPDRSIPFPNDLIYRYNSDIYEDLRAAWESGDCDLVARMWADLRNGLNGA